MSKVKQMMSMVNGSQNPSAMLNQLAMNNPNLKQVMDIVNQYDGDANKAFYATAEKYGVNPQDILNMMK
jgi:hypothetical protein